MLGCQVLTLSRAAPCPAGRSWWHMPAALHVPRPGPLERSHLLSGLRDILSTQKPWALQGTNTGLSPLSLWGRLPVWALGLGVVS